MGRMPNCKYLSQTKQPETNEGIAEYHCSMFGWTGCLFIPTVETSLQNNCFGTAHSNSLFVQCFNCPYKLN